MICSVDLVGCDPLGNCEPLDILVSRDVEAVVEMRDFIDRNVESGT
jgi:hypothetical protein